MVTIDRAELAEHLRRTVSYASHLGLEIQEIAPGRAVFHLEVRDIHMNGAGMVHGGVHASLLDSAMGVALIGLGLRAATSQMNVHYLEAIVSGKLVCSAEVIHRSGRTATVEAKVHHEGGKLVAIASGSFRIFPGSLGPTQEDQSTTETETGGGGR